MKTKICFRADASPTIGYGHFIRSLALADMLKEEFDCNFFTTDPTPYQKKEAEGICRLTVLKGEFLDCLTGGEIVVLDNYFFDTEYQRAIKEKGCRLVCIDDIHDRHFAADVIISQCLDNPALYNDVEKDTALCLGPRWAMLRRPFIQHTPVARKEGHCLICYGGSDPCDFTSKAVAEALDKGYSQVSVVIGDGYAFEGNLPVCDNVKIYRRLGADEMAALMLGAEYVMCSASTTAYEAYACGCKVQTTVTADNQKDFQEMLLRRGLEIDPESTKKNFIKLFKALELDIVNYVDMNEVQSREVWEKRNWPSIRQWMSNTEPFSFESHCSFINALRTSEDKLFYALFKKGVCVGSYSFKEIGQGYADRGLFINPRYHRHGIASAAEIFFDGLIIRRGIHTLKAEVLRGNIRSLDYHLSRGYRIVREDDKYHYLERAI